MSNYARSVLDAKIRKKDNLIYGMFIQDIEKRHGTMVGNQMHLDFKPLKLHKRITSYDPFALSRMSRAIMV